VLVKSTTSDRANVASGHEQPSIHAVGIQQAWRGNQSVDAVTKKRRTLSLGQRPPRGTKCWRRFAARLGRPLIWADRSSGRTAHQVEPPDSTGSTDRSSSIASQRNELASERTGRIEEPARSKRALARSKQALARSKRVPVPDSKQAPEQVRSRQALGQADSRRARAHSRLGPARSKTFCEGNRTDLRQPEVPK